jgi:hypothetical protein
VAVGVSQSQLSILILGNEKWEWNAEHDWAHGFERLGHCARVMDERTPSQKILNAAKTSDLVLLISSGRNTDRGLVKKLNGITTTFAWHADLFWGLRRKGWKGNFMWGAQYCFTADGNNDEKWAEMGVEHKWMLPGIRDRWTEEEGVFNPLYACDVAFVGNNGNNYHEEWPYRSQLVEQLLHICKKHGLTFRNPGGFDGKIERDISMSNFYASSKVTVGDSLCLERHRSLYWSDRVYEATGRGGVLVMPQIDALAEQFPSMPMYEWGNWKNLENVILYLLKDQGEREKVADACKGVTARQHTYSKRAEALLSFFSLGDS